MYNQISPDGLFGWFLVSCFLLKSRLLPWKQRETRNEKQETKHTQTISFCVFALKG